MFYSFHKLQGSQTQKDLYEILPLFYSFHKLQGSQTLLHGYQRKRLFYSFHKLQGSQTSNGHHRTYILGSIVIYFPFILQLNIYLCL